MRKKQDRDDARRLAEAAARIREGRQLLSMTVYAIQRGRRTPDQVRAVLDRSTRAIRRNQIVRRRWTQLLAVH
jgi:hypothetical protein